MSRTTFLLNARDKFKSGTKSKALVAGNLAQLLHRNGENHSGWYESTTDTGTNYYAEEEKMSQTKEQQNLVFYSLDEVNGCIL